MLKYSDHEAVMVAMASGIPQVCMRNDCTPPQYGVVGTSYGHLHNTMGSWRLWGTAGSARRWIRDQKAPSNDVHGSPVFLGNVRFSPSQLYRYGLWQATATWKGEQYDMSKECTISRRVARKQMLHDAVAFFTGVAVKKGARA